jgi:type II secretory pathway pseudopilin PulG
MIKPSRRGRSERGSALLVVLVFAAMIAIMLYRELPVVAFEAQRQKEELLMDRGNEYKRAVQLYVRKIQSFPPTLDALENTNRMRFLRFRYPDPFTGKTDWRILHAGPGGTITDSKIKSTGSTLTGASSTTANALGAPSAVTNPFANSFNGADPFGQANNGAGNTIPQRPPTVSANTGMAGSTTDGTQPTDPNQQTANAPYPGYPGPPDPSNPLANGSSGTLPGGSVPQRYRAVNPVGNSYPPGQFGSQDPQNPMSAALGTTNPPPTVNNTTTTSSSGFSIGQTTASTSTSSASSSGLGTMSSAVGAGIAGVASSVPGKTIKVLNDQSDRSLWEFVYDMQKERNANAPGLGNNNNGNNTQTNGSSNSSAFPGSTPNGSPSQSSMFGSTNTNQ